MKKIFALLTAIACCTIVANAQWHRFNPYFVGPDAVYFEGRVIEDASPLSFKILPDGYAADDWNVYYFGQKIRDASASSFAVLSWDYARDSFNVYFKGRKIPGASVSSFKVLGDWYAADD